MFWGLIMEPQRRYTQKVKKAFHISMASLDISTSSEEPAQVMCGIEGRNYLLCTLRKPDIIQCPLDLNFTIGSELSFAANGKCHVHLTGYLIEDYSDLSEEEVEEETEDEVEEPVKNKKRNNKTTKNGPPAKKSKVKDSGDNDDDSSDESDVNVEDLLQKSFEEDENDDTYLEEEEEDDEEGEEEEEETDDGDGEEEEDGEEDSSSVSDSEEEQSNPVKSSKKSPKMNGIPLKDQSTPKPAKDKKKKQDKESKAATTESKTPNKESKTPIKESKISNKESKTPNKESKIANKESQSPKKKILQGGVIIEDINEGQGPIAKAGKFVTVYYEGRLKQNNKMFDSTTKGSGFSFRLGGGEVIKGWDVGVAGMRLGGKRRIICPPTMAYGAKGSPPAIPANSTLVFEVELKKMR